MSRSRLTKLGLRRPALSKTDPDGSETGREWVKEFARSHGIGDEDALMISKKNDPDWKGTEADHKKAEWFRELWEYAVADRSDRKIHTRGVHYATVMRDEEIEPPTSCKWGVYQNTATCYGYLRKAAVTARILGYVPLDGVLDEKNDQSRITTYVGHVTDPDVTAIDEPDVVWAPYVPQVSSTASVAYGDVDEFIDHFATNTARQLAEQLRLDDELEQPYHIELWSEKTLPREVRRITGVSAVVEGEGDLSYTVASDFAERVNQAGKPGVILYLSDFDPAGSNMARAMASKISWLNRSDRLEQRVVIKKIAITAEQVEEYDFPRKLIDTDDIPANYRTRVDEWQKEHDGGAVELNVLESDIGLFRRIVREGVSELRDRELTVKNHEAIDEWQAAVEEAIHDAFEKWDEKVEEELDTDLDGMLEEAAAWCEEFNVALEDASEHLETLRDLQSDSRFTWWRSWAHNVRRELELPELERPKGEAPLPTDPLFDSDRSRMENLESANRGG